jgi:nucleoid DNA-binding protein
MDGQQLRVNSVESVAYVDSFLFLLVLKGGHVMAKKTADKAPGKPMSKSEIVSGIADTTELTTKQVRSVFEAMTGQIKASLSSRGPGVYTVPGLMKLIVQRKPAVKAHKGVNPFTGAEAMFKAKPARNVVKIRPLKNLKDMV